MHRLTEGEAGIQMSILAVVSILTMVFLSPRLQALPLAAAIALALGTMGVGSELIAYGASVALLLGFVILGVGNGLIDVFMNVAAQGLEVRAPPARPPVAARVLRGRRHLRRARRGDRHDGRRLRSG